MHTIQQDILNEIIASGYIVIFTLVFLQEVGFPNPIPNELVLLFSGYLAYLGKLDLKYAIFSAFLGDILGSAILFSTFYFFGKKILDKKPRWIPISVKKLESLRNTIREKGSFGIFIGRLSPFIRGYISVLSGLINFSKKGFSAIATATALIWATFYLLVGYTIGPFWHKLSNQLTDYTLYIGFIPLSGFLLYLVYCLFKQYFSSTTKTDAKI